MDISLGLFLFICVKRVEVKESESKRQIGEGKSGGQIGSLDHITVLNSGGLPFCLASSQSQISP